MSPARAVYSRVVVPGLCAVLLLLTAHAPAAAETPAPPAAPDTRPATQPATRPVVKRKMSDAEVRRGLERQSLPAKFQATFSEAVDFMRDVTGLEIEVEWAKLKAFGIDEKTPVALNLGKASMHDVLTAILTAAGGKPGVVGYAVVNGKVLIGPTQPPPPPT